MTHGNPGVQDGGEGGGEGGEGGLHLDLRGGRGVGGSCRGCSFEACQELSVPYRAAPAVRGRPAPHLPSSFNSFWCSRGMVGLLVRVRVAVLVWASRCTWPRGAWGGRGQGPAGPRPGPPSVEVEGGLPTLPPAEEEAGEEEVHLGLVGVEHGDGEVRAGQGGGEAAPTTHILAAVVTLYPWSWSRVGRCCCQGRRMLGEDIVTLHLRV